MSEHDELKEAFSRFLDKAGVADALSVATGMFVGLVVSYLEAKGQDASKEITIDGGDKRDITIHAVKTGGKQP